MGTGRQRRAEPMAWTEAMRPMTDHSALIRVFSEYARTLSRRYDVGDVLYRLTDQVSEVLNVDGAGVFLSEGSQLRFVTATDERIVRIEERQIVVGEGPCRDAYTNAAWATAADLAHESRWPGYAAIAVEHGCRAVAGIPMTAVESSVGALNLYACEPRHWTTEELEIAQVLADMATGYILNARTLTESEQLAEQLQHALDTRIVVEQAKGVLVERHGTDPATAFERLRRFARDRNTKVHDVARWIVQGSVEL